jgi:hypothetical protein
LAAVQLLATRPDKLLDLSFLSQPALHISWVELRV